MKINKIILAYNKGFSAIGMVIILLLLGAILIASLNQTSLLKQKNVIYQKNHYTAINRALSSISWAITQDWLTPNDTWQCQTYLLAELNACIKQSTLSTGNYTIIRGQFRQVKRYHLATFFNGKLSIEKGHWLDYCPENRNIDCD